MGTCSSSTEWNVSILLSDNTHKVDTAPTDTAKSLAKKLHVDGKVVLYHQDAQLKPGDFRVMTCDVTPAFHADQSLAAQGVIDGATLKATVVLNETVEV